jgi:hypothetical protein
MRLGLTTAPECREVPRDHFSSLSPHGLSTLTHAPLLLAVLLLATVMHDSWILGSAVKIASHA